jgi:chromosome segregation ATPase
MSMIVELRKEQLKAELATLETAEQRATTLASQLAEADVAVNAASQLVTVNKSRLAEEVAELEALSREAAFVPQGMSGMRANHDIKTQRIDRTIGELTAERDRLEGELRKKQLALGKIVEQIAEHPAYKAVREKQRGLVKEATGLASTLFKVPLDDLSSVMRTISIFSEAENRLISDARSALRDGGLPDIKPLLVRFIQQITPQQLIDAIPYARTQARNAMDQVTESASRDVFR